MRARKHQLMREFLNVREGEWEKVREGEGREGESLGRLWGSKTITVYH